MKTLLALSFGASFLATAAVCALAGETSPGAAPASPPSAARAAGATVLRPSLGAPVRVVLASPYAQAR